MRGVATSKAGRVAGDIHDAIEEATGLDVPIITRTVDEWRAIIDANPSPMRPPTARGSTSSCSTGRRPPPIEELRGSKFEPERLGVSEREVYLSLPDGIGRSKLAAAVMRLDNAKSGTARNWKTVLALAEMASD